MKSCVNNLPTWEKQVPEFTFDEASHTYRLDGKAIGSVTEIIKEAGFNPNTAHYSKRSAHKGQMIHLVTEMYDRDELDESSIDDETTPFLDAYKLFVSETEFIPFKIEHRGYCPVNRFGYTLDRTGICNRETRPILLDIKSGVAEPWHRIQTAAYDSVQAVPHVRYALYLQGNGKYKFIKHDKRVDFERWKAALTMFCFKLETGQYKLKG
ncbi:hypothetical protein N9937_00645 [bacterium]|nr:hypothetical protein [bacterium]